MNQRTHLLSLAPGFSRVSTLAGRSNRFSGFCAGGKPLKRLAHSSRANTRLKPGANESASMISAIPAPFRSGLKGHPSIAQGKGSGVVWNQALKARHNRRRVPPFQGLIHFRASHPGLCPGLSNDAPLGLRPQAVALRCSADLQSAVSPNCIRHGVRNGWRVGSPSALQIENLRYSRVQLCATTLSRPARTDLTICAAMSYR